MSVQSFLLTVHLNRESNLESKTLTTSKLKELQGPKVRLKLPLLGAPIPPNFMRFRCTVMEKCRRNISQHTCMHDDLYHPCTFAWGQSQTLTTPNLKELQSSKSRCKQLLLAATTTPNFVVFRCMVPKNGIKHFHIQGDGLQKRLFFVTVRKKSLIKVQQFQVTEKRN